MAAVSARVALPSCSGLKVQASRKVFSSASTVSAAPLKISAAMDLKKIGQALVASSASFLIAGSAFADVTILAGANDGSLAFVPKEVTVASGSTITFKNNVGFPHNVVFDEDDVPEGVDADAISVGSLNSPDSTHVITLTVPGTYSYVCEPHQGVGMVGIITVT